MLGHRALLLTYPHGPRRHIVAVATGLAVGGIAAPLEEGCQEVLAQSGRVDAQLAALSQASRSRLTLWGCR